MICTRTSPPSVGTEAPRATEPTAPDRNVAVGSHGEYVPRASAAASWCVNAAVSKAVTLTFDLESGLRVTCDVGYLCANFGLPRPHCILDLGPMYTTDRRQTKASLNAPAY